MLLGFLNVDSLLRYEKCSENVLKFEVILEDIMAHPSGSFIRLC